MHFPITSVQLTLNRSVTGNSMESLNGYMVAPREDTGVLGAGVAYLGSWILGSDQKHVCGNVSTFRPFIGCCLNVSEWIHVCKVVSLNDY